MERRHSSVDQHLVLGIRCRKQAVVGKEYHIAISACNRLSSSSSSSSSCCCCLFPRTIVSVSMFPLFTGRNAGYSRSPVAALGNRCTLSATGTEPVLSMLLSSSCCCRSANSRSSSSSSTALAPAPWVRAEAISLEMACCSSRSSL